MRPANGPKNLKRVFFYLNPPTQPYPPLLLTVMHIGMERKVWINGLLSESALYKSPSHERLYDLM